MPEVEEVKEDVDMEQAEDEYEEVVWEVDCNLGDAKYKVSMLK